MTTKPIWDELGGLDEVFNPGVGDDIDFSIRVQKAGYKIETVLPNFEINGTFYPIYHKEKSDYNTNKKRLINRNCSVLVARHGATAGWKPWDRWKYEAEYDPKNLGGCPQCGSDYAYADAIPPARDEDGWFPEEDVKLQTIEISADEALKFCPVCSWESKHFKP